MKTIKKIIFGVSIIFLLASCKKEMIDFLGINAVYFDVQIPTPTGLGTWPHVDTSTVRFSTTIEDDSIYKIRVKLYGKVENYDRTINVKILNTSTAVLDREYESFPTSFILPAGENICYLPIKVLRSDSVFNDHKYLSLELESSNDFSIQLSYILSTKNEAQITSKIDVVRHTVDISDAVYQPTVWQNIYLGVYSDYKFILLNETFGLTQEDWKDQKTMPSNKMQYMGMTFKRYLLEQAAIGNIIYERDRKGEIVYQKNENGEFILDKDGNKIPTKLEMGTYV